METKTVFLIIGIISVVFILKSCIQSTDKNLHNRIRSSTAVMPSKIVQNDKLVVVKNISRKEIEQVLKQFCNLYNEEGFRAIIRLTVVSDSTFMLTFPYNIDFICFCFLVNYLNYPHEMEYNASVIAWTTTSQNDSWMKGNIIDKKVMIYVDKEDKDCDNVYLTSYDNIGYRMGFAMGEESQQLEKPSILYQELNEEFKNSTGLEEIVFD